MSRGSTIRTSGGKGNINMFIERDKKICAAGLPNLDNASISNIFPCYQLQDHANALLHDIIIPETSYDPRQLSSQRDMRNAGMFTESADLINPPMKTKFQTLVDDFKNTQCTSYWKKEIGKVPDPKGNLPEGLNVYGTTMGKKYPPSLTSYEVIFPTQCIEDQVPRSKRCGLQTQRNYCSFNANQTFGKKTNIDSSSKRMNCCLTDDRIYVGNNSKIPMHFLQARFNYKNTARVGETQEPNNNIDCVPKGFAFGKVESLDGIGVPECLTVELNPDRKFLKECLAHLNTLRKCMSKRFDGAFFPKFYLEIKYLDTQKTGWLPKDIIYDTCKLKYIRFNEELLEPLMSIWNILDGSRIEYKKFIHMLNYREPVLELPKISDIPEENIDYRTTYSEMCKENVENTQKYMAGVPSGRYLDKDYPITPDGLCRADRDFLPQESDAKCCISPSILTLHGVSHRDMFAKRDAKTVRKVFENIGEEFTDESFDSIWLKAQEYHSQGWVSYETFRRALADKST
ncbi:unnamed protein product [Pieris brassicae]|uniref:EFHB C-terminal EF-hand domain-containing protein n=1 Tax=Pieris brassicae TaxID=7116 RepID=A0A9P0TDH3_PIEBR|nr:unnamed protein product [Pieris brassicae]